MKIIFEIDTSNEKPEVLARLVSFLDYCEAVTSREVKTEEPRPAVSENQKLKDDIARYTYPKRES